MSRSNKSWYFCSYCEARGIGEWKELRKQGWAIFTCSSGAPLRNTPKAPLTPAHYIQEVACPSHHKEVSKLVAQASDCIRFGRMREKQERWHCYVCGKEARGTFVRLEEREWASFSLWSRVCREFSLDLCVQLCPEHDMDTDQVVQNLFSGRSWSIWRQTSDDATKTFKRVLRDEEKRDLEKRQAPKGYA